MDLCKQYNAQHSLTIVIFSALSLNKTIMCGRAICLKEFRQPLCISIGFKSFDRRKKVGVKFYDLILLT